MLTLYCCSYVVVVIIIVVVVVVGWLAELCLCIVRHASVAYLCIAAKATSRRR
jgi:hypothetical protein